MRNRLLRHGRTGMRARRTRLRPSVEAMEGRRLLASFGVSHTGDDGDGSLRRAILDANDNPGVDVIAFRLDPGDLTIAPAAPLPPITDPVVIDGTSQPGFEGTPIVELTGVAAGEGADGLRILSGGSTVRGLIINGFIGGGFPGDPVFTGGSGIVLESGGGNRVEGNSIGTDRAGASILGNVAHGVLILGSPGNTIGGTAAGAGNVISGNGVNGVLVMGDGAVGNLIQGNMVGMDVGGTLALGNSFRGVSVVNAPMTTIGGMARGARNVISANSIGGVEIAGESASGTVVLGNFIGTDATGAVGLGGHFESGLSLVDAPGNTIGGTSPGARNVISGNGVLGFGAGVRLVGSGSRNNMVLGNSIGTDADGATAVSNLGDGLRIDGASDNTIGGTAPGAGNLISGNGGIVGSGIVIDGSAVAASGNVVQGNLIGTDASGTIALGNGSTDPDNPGHGIFLQMASGNTVGGTAAGARNVISGNPGDGIFLFGSPDAGDEPGGGAGGNAVLGNLIGTDANGTAALPNEFRGIRVSTSRGNTIGGTEPGARNVISGNGLQGILIISDTSSANVVLGNFIGTDASGTLGIGNGDTGVAISEAPDNTVGGASPGARNVISGNARDGVLIANDRASGNLVLGNFIGTDVAGTADLGNGVNGVRISFSRSNRVGGGAAGSGNLISGNDRDGVVIAGNTSMGNVVQGNLIGTDVGGSSDLGNAARGVVIDDAVGNLIGGPAEGEGNVISANDEDGIQVIGVATRNAVQGNLIGTDASGSRPLGNSSDGVEIINAPGNLIGGASPGSRNVISGNGLNGIALANHRATGILVQGNLIGTDANGTADLGNAVDGVFILNVPGVIIGGLEGPDRNVIAGNDAHGIHVIGRQSSGIVIVGNLIGTDISGAAALGNLRDGILIDGAPGTAIGGAVGPAGNLISGNGGAGVELLNAGATNTSVVGNLIGTDRDGRSPLGNQTGVFLNNAPGNTVGGLAAGSRNLISANLGDGVQVGGVGATGNVVLGNFIGTDASGDVGLGNRVGVVLQEAAANTVGGATAEARNLISGNVAFGVHIFGAGATRNLVLGNFIGTDARGLRAVLGPGAPDSAAARQDTGILINEGGIGNTIGGTSAEARNLISGNVAGIAIAGFNAGSNQVWGNFIGTDRDGMAPLGNEVGIYINAASDNLIGGTAPGAGNVISGNRSVGVHIFGTLSANNLVQGNLIGTDAGGRDGLRNPDRTFVQGNGVFISGAPRNRVGGTAPGAGNLIAGHAAVGVYLFGEGTAGNVVQGNRIGLPVGRRDRVRSQYGALLYNAPANTVARMGPSRNRFAGSGLATFREFSGPVGPRAGRPLRPPAGPGSPPSFRPGIGVS